MKKTEGLVIALLLATVEAACCQNGQGAVVSAQSGFKHINTLHLFDPEAEKEEKPSKNADTPIVKLPTDPKDTKEKNKPVPAFSPAPSLEESQGIKTLLFTKSLNTTNKRENAQFYRKIKFDKTGTQPKGTVTDFYVSNDKPRFIGQYRKYISTYEEKNTEFDGICKFFNEDGSYVAKTYTVGRVRNEIRYTAADEKIAEIEYNPDGKRKKFTEYVYDKSGTRIGNLEGGVNAEGRLEAKETIFYPTKQVKSEKEFIDGCPKPKATFYKENGQRFTVFYQDFTCIPTNLSFTNQSFFEKTHNADSQTFVVRAVENKAEGIMQMSVPYDFINNPFEVVVVFDLASIKPMSEFGLVWEFIDSKNYCYLKIDPQKKTYEVNSVKDGVPGKNMLGIKPQNIEIDGSQVTITLRKTDEGIIYGLNDKPLQYLKNNIPANFTKLPVVDPNGKKWGLGFFFKSNVINESISLKSLEVKLLQ